MKKEKILLVHNYYQVPGGEDTVVENEYRLLKENGHEVILYTRRNDEIKSYGFIKKLRLIFNTIFSIKTYKEVKQIIENENIDIVHVHNTLPLISPSVYYAAFKTKTPVVQTIHNFRLLCPAATLTRDGQICEDCIQKGLINALKHKCYRNSFFQTLAIVLMIKLHKIIGTFDKIDLYIALTEFNKKKLEIFVKDKSKIYIKPNFAFKENTNVAVKRNIKNYFVYMGRLDKIKGFNFLIEVWKDINESQLIAIGDGPEKSWAENFIKENNLDNIKLLGFLKREEAFRILKDAKALVIPSRCYEGFPMIIPESLSLGVPIIASNIGNLKTIVNEKIGLLFEPDNIQSLIRAIKEFDNKDDILLMDISYNCINEFNEKYSHYSNYKILYNAYSKVRCSKKCKD